MPLPANDTPWPPRQLDCVVGKYSEWGAWYSGDPAELSRAYLKADPALAARPSIRSSQLRGGVVGAAARFFWGTPNTTNMPKAKLHVPIAGDLCQATGDLLFAEQPTLTISSEDATAGQERLDTLLDDGAVSVLAEGAEVGAAFGDAYLRVTWDPVLMSRPFLTTVHADAALPEFRWGQLVAVTFWHVLRREGQQIWRHLERHELDANGIGIILHGLYRGTETSLGMAVALSELPETAGIVLNDVGVVSTGTPGLAVERIPNQRPQRRWRNEPLASNFGRSDLDGVEGLMDAFDETYTSWMRDIRLGKARLLVGESALEALGPGKGNAFDTDREVFTGLQLPPTSLNGGSTTSQIAQAVQFQIRFAEHKSTADELLALILHTAGYSTQTFGDGNDVATTATEVTARERRTYMTRDRKIRLWRPAVARIFGKLLAVDGALFSGPVKGEVDIEVQFADGVQESMLSLAQTAQAMEQAQAASTRTLVALLHPDWDDQQVDAEVALIKGQAPQVPDPSQFLPEGAQPQADPAVGSQDAGQS